jgi:hypothetical protein
VAAGYRRPDSSPPTTARQGPVPEGPRSSHGQYRPAVWELQEENMMPSPAAASGARRRPTSAPVSQSGGELRQSSRSGRGMRHAFHFLFMLQNDLIIDMAHETADARS